MAEKVKGRLEVEEKEGAKGPYLSALINKWHYNIFPQGEFDKFEAAKGQVVQISYNSQPRPDGGQYRNYVAGSLEIAPAEKLPETTTVPTSPDTMSKADWAEKDRLITRVAIAKSCIEAGLSHVDADKWVAWVYQKGAVNPTAKAPIDTATLTEEETSQEGALDSATGDAEAPAPIIEGIETPNDLIQWGKKLYGMTSKQVMEPIPPTKFAKLSSEALTKIAEQIALARGK